MRLLRTLLLLTFLGVALLASDMAHALDPARSFSQYKRTAWTVDEGAPTVILALTQGRDGYLWIGARDGLFRFDGFGFDRILPERPMAGEPAVTSLLTGSDGALWVGYGLGSVSVYRDGQLRDSGLKPGSYVVKMVQTSDGAIWAGLGDITRPLARYYRGQWQDIGPNQGLPREHTMAIIAARDGTLWVSTLQSVLFLKKGAARFERADIVPSGHAALTEDSAGRIWISDVKGTRPIGGVKSGRFVYPTPLFPRSVRTFFDRDGNLWAAAGRNGMFRVRRPDASGAPSAMAAAAQVELAQDREGIDGDIYALTEDREGNIWTGSLLGLERFRETNVVTEPALRRPSLWGYSLLAASDGAVYVGQADSLYRIAPGGTPGPVLARSTEVEAVCEAPDRAIWVALKDRVVRMRGKEMLRISRPRTTGLGIFDCAVDGQNRLWLSAYDDGLFRYDGRTWLQFRNPVGRGGAKAMIGARDGGLLFYDDGRSILHLDVMKQPPAIARVATMPRLYTIYQGSRDVLLGGALGLARLRDGQVQQLSSDRAPALGGAAGIVQTPEGETWLIAKPGLVRLSTAALDRAFADPRLPLQPTEILDWRDGLPGTYMRDGKRDAVRGGDGRLWFATSRGVAWVDPAHMTRNPLPPPVRIGALTARGKTYRDPSNVSLPAGTSSGEIDYAALSLSIPERVQVRYRLEGMDAEWIDPGTRRQMFFSNLGPGTYRFRVIASNNDGVWNREGATLTFTIPATFLQSIWFKLICVIAVLALLWLIYALRLRQVRAQIQTGMEVRIAERERIARELHDTLLQGFQGLVLHFQAAANRIPVGLLAHTRIEEALRRADTVLAEGRESVRELRMAVHGGDLVEAWIAVAADFGVGGSVDFDLTVEGAPRALQPLVQDEVQRIGEEAIRNAFHHSRANAIRVILSYGSRQLRLLVHDDGIGLPPGVAATGERPGHYGLTGMRERAHSIGAGFTIVSREGGGTEVLLSIPGRLAYVEYRGFWAVPSFLSAKPKG